MAPDKNGVLVSKGKRGRRKKADEHEPAAKTPKLSEQNNREIEEDSQVQQLLRVLEKSIEKKILDIEKFSATANQDFSRWIEDFNFRTNTEDENTKLGLLKVYLGGDAREVLDSLSVDVSRSYLRTVDALKKFFDKNSTSELLDALESIKLEPHQSLKLFGVRISNLVKKLYPGNEEAVNESIIVNYFIRGLDPEVGRRLRIRKHETLAYAINKAEVIVEELRTKTTEKSVVNAVETQRETKEEDDYKALINLLKKLNTNERNISSLYFK